MAASGARGGGGEENTFKEKIKTIFGISSAPSRPLEAPGRVPVSAGSVEKRPVQTFVLPPDVFRDISPDSPANHRLKSVRSLTEVVAKKKLENHAIEALWQKIADMVEPTSPQEIRQTALRFLCCLIKGQFDWLDGRTRDFFFRVISAQKPRKEDFPLLFETLKELLVCGKNVDDIEEEIGPVLCDWMKQFIIDAAVGDAAAVAAFKTDRTDLVIDFLTLLINMFKFNAAYMSDEAVSCVLSSTCELALRSTEEQIVLLSIQLVETNIFYGFLPSSTLPDVIYAACRLINIQSNATCKACWKAMRHLLGTHLGHLGIYHMCCLMQEVVEDSALVRGAVFYTGMSLWGSQKVASLKHTPTSVLPSFIAALRCNSTIVAVEVLLSVERLVKKFSDTLTLIAWELVLDVLEKSRQFLPHVHLDNEVKKLKKGFHEVLTPIENLYFDKKYCGNAARLLQLIKDCSDERPENSVIKLLAEMGAEAKHSKPSQEDIPILTQMMELYFKKERRVSLRLMSLEILAEVYRQRKSIHKTDIIESVMVPFLLDLDREPEDKLASEGLRLLTDALQDIEEPLRRLDILSVFDRIISSSLDAQSVQNYSPPSTRLTTAIFGLLRIFVAKMMAFPPTFAAKIYEILLAQLNSHVAEMIRKIEDPSTVSVVDSPSAVFVRQTIVTFLLNFRYDSLNRLGLPMSYARLCSTRSPTSSSSDSLLLLLTFSPNSPDSQTASSGLILWSPFFVAASVLGEGLGRVSHESSPTSSPVVTPTPPPSRTFCLNYTQAFQTIISMLEHERNWLVLEQLLDGLPRIIENKSLIISANSIENAACLDPHPLLGQLCVALCQFVSNKNIFDLLVGKPAKGEDQKNFSRSDFHVKVFPALIPLCSYQSFLDGARKRELLRCLEFGLVSRHARQCVSALTVCSLEMTDTMLRQLPSILLRLSQISATTSMAVPVLEFLSTLVRVPRLYASFVEDQYLNVFAIALPYANPWKFNHFAVSLAYTVIAFWFIKCRQPLRKNFVSFITKGLKTNIQRELGQKFEVNTGLRERKGSAPGQEMFLPLDQSSLKLHTELIESCLDLLARYTHSSFSLLPRRSPVAEFLLKGGRTEHWIVGTMIVSITTSSSGGKAINSGLCDKCAELTSSSTADTKTQDEDETKDRRRHVSAFTQPTAIKQVTRPRYSEVGKSSQGLLNMKQHSEEDPKDPYVSKSTHSSSAVRGLCNCWCESWAEIVIRRPSGNASWIMRIQNEQGIDGEAMPLPLADIHALLKINSDQQSGSDSRSSNRVHERRRIDSEHLKEADYECLYEKHFSESVAITEDVTESYRQNSNDNSCGPSIAGSEREFSAIGSASEEASEHEPVLQRSSSSPDLTKMNSTQLLPGNKNTSSPLPSPDRPSLERPSEFPKPAPVRKLAVNDIDPMESSLSASADGRLSECPVSETNNSREIVNITRSTENDTFFDSQRRRVHTVSVSSALAYKKMIRPNSLTQTTAQKLLPKLAREGKASIQFALFNKRIPDRVPTDSITLPTKATEKNLPDDSLRSESVKTGLDPRFVYLQLFHSGIFAQSLPDTEPNLWSPIHIAENPERAIGSIDAIYPYETHDIGVLYVAKGQMSLEKPEFAILANMCGSTRYINFLAGLGRLVALKGRDANSRLDDTYLDGLDTSNGRDGLYTYHWKDDITQVCFHVATLMPNDQNNWRNINKKKHIGNDAVHIVYNDSGIDYKNGTIQSQFNYASVVIKPVEHCDNIVHVQSKEDIAEVIGHSEPHIVSDANLPLFVRQLAIHANLAARIHVSVVRMQRKSLGVVHPCTNNWVERCKAIKRLRMRLRPPKGKEQDIEPLTKDSPRIQQAKCGGGDPYFKLEVTKDHIDSITDFSEIL